MLGCAAPVASLRAALGAKPGDVREQPASAWAEVASAAALERARSVATSLGKPAWLIAVEMSAGGRGKDVRAILLTIGADGSVAEEDWTEWAREAVHDWIADNGDSFDAEDASSELAWTLAGEVGDRPQAEVSDDRDGRWARDLIAALAAAGHIELGDKPLMRQLTAQVARELPDDDARMDKAASAILDVLVESGSVEEVFADAPEIAAALRTTRPG